MDNLILSVLIRAERVANLSPFYKGSCYDVNLLANNYSDTWKATLHCNNRLQHAPISIPPSWVVERCLSQSKRGVCNCRYFFMAKMVAFFFFWNKMGCSSLVKKRVGCFYKLVTSLSEFYNWHLCICDTGYFNCCTSQIIRNLHCCFFLYLIIFIA